MFKITIEGDTLEAFHSNLQQLAAQFGVPTAAPKAKTAPKAKAAPTDEDAAIEAELNEPVPPAPAGSDAVVDAGTGQPIEPVVKMSMDDVKKAATQLAAKDTPKLKELIEKHGGTKLSDIPKDTLGDFAADVMEALG